MSTMDKLLKRLSAEKVTSVGEALERKKGEWLDDLQRLLDQIQTWLAAGEADGTVAIDRSEVEIAEQDLGPYRVPTLTIRTLTRSPAIVRIEPRGMRVVGVVAVGAAGRVDMTAGPSRVILLRFTSDGTTRWTAILDDGTKEALTPDTFASALTYLLDLEG
jgi:hypothetical protein